MVRELNNLSYLKFISWPACGLYFVKLVCIFEKSVYSDFVEVSVLNVSIRLMIIIVLFKSSVFLLIFFLLTIKITERSISIHHF